MNEKEKMIAGQFYNPEDPTLVADKIRARKLAFAYNNTPVDDWEKKNKILAELIPNSQNAPYFEPNIRVEYGYNIHLGKNFYANYDCMLLDVCPITVGDNVMFGPGVVVATPLHPLLHEERNPKQHSDGFYDLEYGAPIRIGSNCWIASRVTILPGVTIGEGTVIGAGSLVTHDIPGGVLAFGNPCRVIRPLSEKDKLNPEALHSSESN